VASMSDAQPAGFGVLARSFAEVSFADFPRIDVPTLLLYAVTGEFPERRIRRSRPDPDLIPAGQIVTLPGIRHPGSGAAPDRFNAAVLDFLRAHT
jgi:pimeloyl-ACP methyl ester carboxylesterase